MKKRLKTAIRQAPKFREDLPRQKPKRKEPKREDLNMSDRVRLASRERKPL